MLQEAFESSVSVSQFCMTEKSTEAYKKIRYLPVSQVNTNKSKNKQMGPIKLLSCCTAEETTKTKAYRLGENICK